MQKTLALPVSLPLAQTKIIFLSLAFLSFAVPFSLGNSQIITGTIVNAALFSSAVLLPKKYFLPIIIFPSLGVLSRGIIFGPLTPFLLYFIPFIWLANLSLVIVLKKAFSSLGYFPAGLLACLAKATVLFLFANLFFRLNIVPLLFLTIMGANQLITACFGGVSAFFLLRKASNGKL